MGVCEARISARTSSVGMPRSITQVRLALPYCASILARKARSVVLSEVCSATIWMGRRRSGMYFDGRGGLMIVAARQDCKLYFVGRNLFIAARQSGRCFDCRAG